MQNIEGHVPVPGGNVWYKVCGYANSNSAPLIVIHGGPGYPHDYLEPLLDLSSERPVIFYDQLGCGNSDDVTDTTLWTPEHFRDELEHVVSTLELDEYHILGHSWGAAVAVSFAITRPTGLHSLILSDPYISTAVWNDDATRLMKLLETHVHERLEGTPDKTAEYKAALKEYYRRFIYRTDHYPEACRRADKKMNADVYKYMWGRNELKITGTLKDFDQTSGLSEIDGLRQA